MPPTRRGAAAGAFGALKDVLEGGIDRSAREDISNQEALRNDQLERARTADQLIASGKLGPEDRASYISGKYTGPSVQQKVGSMIGDITKAPDMSQTPSRVALGQFAQENKLPMTYGPMDTGWAAGPPKPPVPSVSTTDSFGNKSGDDTPAPLPSTPMGPISTGLNTLLAARDAKKQSIGPSRFTAGMQGTGPDAVATETPQKYNPDTGQMDALNPMVNGPTAGQQGGFTGTSKATADALTNPEEIQKAADTTRATTQAGIDVTDKNPSNVAAAAGKAAAVAAAVEKARSDMVAQGVPAEMAANFVNHTALGGAYTYIDPSIPTDIRKGVMTRLAADPVLASAKPVTKEQNDLLHLLDNARGSLAQMMDVYSKTAPKDAAGRFIQGPKNTLDALSQANPQLAAARNAFTGQSLEILRAASSNVPGLRMSTQAMQAAEQAVPQGADTFNTARDKVSILADTFERIEKSILGSGGK